MIVFLVNMVFFIRFRISGVPLQKASSQVLIFGTRNMTPRKTVARRRWRQRKKVWTVILIQNFVWGSSGGQTPHRWFLRSLPTTNFPKIVRKHFSSLPSDLARLTKLFLTLQEKKMHTFENHWRPHDGHTVH